MEIRIENAKPEHVEAIQDVFYRAWLHTYPNEEVGVTVEDVEDRFKNRHAPERLEKRRNELRSLDANKKFLVALDGERVVGVARGSKDEQANRLNAMYVLPAYQGKGIGMMLWNEMNSFFEGSKDILVRVATYNTKATAFYEKVGFVDTGRRYEDERLRMKSGIVLPEKEMVITSK